MAETTVVLRIRGMTCEGCSQTIERYLKRDKGVKKADIDWKAGTGAITYDPALTSPENVLKNRVFTLAYRAEAVEDKA